MHVSCVYLCRQKQIQLTKTGKEYGSLVLQDKTGSMDAKIWDLNNPGIGVFEALDYVYVEADVTLFQNTFQMNVRRIRKADKGEFAPEDYLPVSKKDIPLMWQELSGFVASITNPYLKRLTDSFFVDDKGFIRAFCKHSAAKSVHHSFVGGLLEHTLSVVKLCDYYAGYYPLLNRDLLLTAALFHDVGKIAEISNFPENGYTDDGQLLGHIIIATEVIGARMRSIEGFPHKLASELKHCILAHHGEFEFGSPKKPALIEALALNLADNTDAKLQIMTELLQSAKDNTGWLGFQRLLDTNVRRTGE